MRLEKYINKGGKKLRYGYTTGSCATAAAKAATMMLVSQESVHSVEIDTPKGWMIELNIHDIEVTEHSVSCSVIKDSGDDPDVTDGMKIYARVSYNKTLQIVGGTGVGVVTKKGLSIPVGEPAINPVPRQTITKEVLGVLPRGKGVLIEISAPDEVEISKRTFNPNLGIVNGISIIGTSGIVEPMSEEALKESLALELAVLEAEGSKSVIFVPGNYGQEYAIRLGLSKRIMLKTSNFIGYMLDKAEEIGIEKILLVGHLGKLIKVAGGIFQTHSKYADARMEIMAAYCGACGACQPVIRKILNCLTTDEAVEIIKSNNLSSVFKLIANRICERAVRRTHNTIKLETVIFSKEHGELARSANANQLLEDFTDGTCLRIRTRE